MYNKGASIANHSVDSIIKDEEWFHLAYSIGTNYMSIYVNGKIVVSFATTSISLNAY